MAKACKSLGMVNLYRPCDSFIGGGRRKPLRPLSEPVDGPEGAVLLNDGEEDLGGASCIFGPTVMMLPLISNRPASLIPVTGRYGVTVEGVETREQFERLKSLDVNFAQGYLMGRPVPIDELEGQPLVYRPCQDAAEVLPTIDVF
jgi:hypothetical protein